MMHSDRTALSKKGAHVRWIEISLPGNDATDRNDCSSANTSLARAHSAMVVSTARLRRHMWLPSYARNSMLQQARASGSSSMPQPAVGAACGGAAPAKARSCGTCHIFAYSSALVGPVSTPLLRIVQSQALAATARHDAADSLLCRASREQMMCRELLAAPYSFDKPRTGARLSAPRLLGCIEEVLGPMPYICTQIRCGERCCVQAVPYLRRRKRAAQQLLGERPRAGASKRRQEHHDGHSSEGHVARAHAQENLHAHYCARHCVGHVACAKVLCAVSYNEAAAGMRKAASASLQCTPTASARALRGVHAPSCAALLLQATQAVQDTLPHLDARLPQPAAQLRRDKRLECDPVRLQAGCRQTVQQPLRLRGIPADAARRNRSICQRRVCLQAHHANGLEYCKALAPCALLRKLAHKLCEARQAWQEARCGVRQRRLNGGQRGVSVVQQELQPACISSTLDCNPPVLLASAWGWVQRWGTALALSPTASQRMRESAPITQASTERVRAAPHKQN